MILIVSHCNSLSYVALFHIIILSQNVPIVVVRFIKNILILRGHTYPKVSTLYYLNMT